MYISYSEKLSEFLKNKEEYGVFEALKRMKVNKAYELSYEDGRSLYQHFRDKGMTDEEAGKEIYKIQHMYD